MEQDIGNIRRTLMRLLYFLTFISLVPESWNVLSSGTTPIDPLEGVAFSFWGAFGVLAFFGVLYPVKMLPLMLLQFCYKLVWLVGVGLPHSKLAELDPTAEGLIFANGLGVVLDLLVIPWIFVFTRYFKKPVLWIRK